MFQLDPDVTFLNHGSFGATPAPVRAAQDRWRDEMEREPVDFLVRRLPGLLGEARAALAPFLGGRAEDLAFVQNATTGANAVIDSIALRPGDELLTTDHRYDAVRNALAARAERAGARVVEAPLPFPDIDEDAVVSAILDAISPRTRLLVVDWITSPTALVLPVARIVAGARERGVPVLVDGAHTPGHVPVHLDALGADWWVGNLHKWVCAPKGSALLWARPDRHAELRAPVTSHGWMAGLQAELEWPGTFDPTAWLAAPDALRWHGGAALMADNLALAAAARPVVAEAAGLDLPPPPPPGMRCAMVAFPLDGVPPARAVEMSRTLFQERRLEVPVLAWGGRTWCRYSAMARYNSIDQYALLGEELRAMLPRFRRSTR